MQLYYKLFKIIEIFDPQKRPINIEHMSNLWILRRHYYDV